MKYSANLILLLLIIFNASLLLGQELPPNVTAIINESNEKKEIKTKVEPLFASIGEQVFNAGEFSAPGQVNHIFTYENSGNAPLEIEIIQSGCDCQVTNLDKNILKPGEKGSFTMSLELYPHWAGRELSRSIWFRTNDPEKKHLYFTLKAYVKEADIDNKLR